MNSILTTVTSTLLFILIVQSFIMYQRWGHIVYKRLMKGYSYAFFISLLSSLLLANQIANPGIVLGLIAGSFMLVHMSIYLFYRPKDSVSVKSYSLPAAVVSLVPFIFYFVNDTVGLILITILIVGYSGYSFYYILPKMLNRWIFTATLVLFAFAAVASMIEGISKSGSLMSQLFMLTAYFFCFLLHFSRVLDVLQGVTMNSISDGLTGVYNAKTIRLKAAEALEQEKLKAVLFIDIDHFKQLNDTRGHAEGDNVLKQVAEIIQYECRDKGIVGRYGGEELLVLLTNVPENSTLLAEHIRSSIEKQTIVTISIGYCKYSEEMDAPTIINSADKALYAAKAAGRNRVVNFHELEEEARIPVRVSSQV